MTEAFVFVNCFIAMAGAVENMAKLTEGVSGTYLTSGIYDLVLKIKAPDDKLSEVIVKVKSIPGVAAVLTSIISK